MSTVTIKGKCDICNKKDGFRGHNLQQCRRCGVVAHETCMGLVSTKTKNQNWECYACQATEGGTKPRPTECILCCVKDGLHVMHPLYDTHGRRGKPRIIPADKHGPSRPAWVHTLCAMFIASNPFTKGCVYGCDIDGHYEGDSDDESESSEEDYPVNANANESRNDSSISSGSGSDSGFELMSLHHFVIAHRDKSSKPTPWTRRIAECRTLKCIFCGQSDKTHSLRIPVQCCWNSADELEEFKKRHRPQDGSEDCYVAMHVGCARWALNDFGQPPPCNRVFFYPGVEILGDNDTFVEPICNSFCATHSAMIQARKPKKSQAIEASSSSSRSTTFSKQTPQHTTARRPQSVMKSSISAAAKEIKRKEMELIAQNNIKEKRRKEQQQRQLDLSKTMIDDLFQTILQLMQQGVSKSDIVAARKQRKIFWAKESKLGKDKFLGLWSTVESTVQNSDSFKMHYSAWLKKIEISNSKPTLQVENYGDATIRADSDDNDDDQDGDQDGDDVGNIDDLKKTEVDVRLSSSSDDDDDNNDDDVDNVDESKYESPWKHIWHPNDKDVKFDFGEWDTFEYIDSLSD